jgi:hypothetical protein
MLFINEQYGPGRNELSDAFYEALLEEASRATWDLFVGAGKKMEFDAGKLTRMMAVSRDVMCGLLSR